MRSFPCFLSLFLFPWFLSFNSEKLTYCCFSKRCHFSLIFSKWREAPILILLIFFQLKFRILLLNIDRSRSCRKFFFLNLFPKFYCLVQYIVFIFTTPEKFSNLRHTHKWFILLATPRFQWLYWIFLNIL